MILVHSRLFVSDNVDIAHEPNRGFSRGLWYPNPAASRLITISASAVIYSRPRPYRCLNSHPSCLSLRRSLLLLLLYTSIVISATLHLTLSHPLFSIRLNGFLQITHRNSHHETVSAGRFLSLSGFSSPPFLLYLSNESSDIEFLRAGACSGTIMNKASSHWRLRQGWRAVKSAFLCRQVVS